MHFKNKLNSIREQNQTMRLGNASFMRKLSAVIYRLLGRKLVAKLLVTSSRCNNCHRCLDVCPNKALVLKLNNPYRNHKCKGCLLCIQKCPKNAFVMSPSRLVTTFALLFLPYDQWIGKLFSLSFSMFSTDLKEQLLSFVLWSAGYILAVFIFNKSAFILSTIPAVKKLGEQPSVKNIHAEINPATVFPVIIPK